MTASQRYSAFTLIVSLSLSSFIGSSCGFLNQPPPVVRPTITETTSTHTFQNDKQPRLSSELLSSPLLDNLLTTTANEIPFLKKLKTFNKKEPTAPLIVPGVGIDGCRLPAPSRVNTLPKIAQAKVFVGVMSAILLGTDALTSVLTDLKLQYGWFESFSQTWPILGALYVVFGITHFTVKEEYCNIYPAKGSWGLWYLPGSPQFHVEWTGVAEILGGLGLFVGSVLQSAGYDSPNLLSPAGVASDSAAMLFFLTWAVTPANIYMYTHGAKLPTSAPEIPVPIHAVRGLLQIVLLAMFYQMGEGTFAAWFPQ